MDGIDEIMESLTSEIKRGTLTLSVLTLLKQTHYGYSLSQLLYEKGLPVDQNTLYPLLRRFEKQGLLVSEWVLDDSRPRRYYVLSDQGEVILKKLTEQWEEMTRAMLNLLV